MMPEVTAEGLARFRRAVHLRDRCVAAAVERGMLLNFPVDPTQARVPYDAMVDLIRADERERVEAARREPA